MRLQLTRAHLPLLQGTTLPHSLPTLRNARSLYRLQRLHKLCSLCGGYNLHSLRYRASSSSIGGLARLQVCYGTAGRLCQQGACYKQLLQRGIRLHNPRCVLCCLAAYTCPSFALCTSQQSRGRWGLRQAF